MRRVSRPAVLLVTVAILVCAAGSWSVASEGDSLETGPTTEDRFPPLTVPDGFKATLFACDPLVEYPSVIAIGPQFGTLFVAHDYVTGLGVEIVRRDEIRMLRDTDHDGYADKSQLYAKGFNSIQGLAYHDGEVFVMHAPLLTALQDTDGDGVADVRRDLIVGLGLPPEENSNRLHCANGVVVGHDGWLYLALGDRGCDVTRPEGDRLLFQAGGILRCRLDGRDLHVFATGLRNIYDIVLDEELNVFVRDNENDGGDYMIRVCHSFHGADHGYPYLYPERPAEAISPLADLGRGSSAGGTAYLETAFPIDYRRSLFFCEWGRAVVRYEVRRSEGYFEPMQETDFAAGASDDPYGFKPTDLVVDYDGSLLVSDWGDGQRPKRGRGRIYRISAVGPSRTPSAQVVTVDTPDDKLIEWLSSEGYHQRCAAQYAIEKRAEASAEQGQRLLKQLQRSMKDSSMTALGRLHGVWIIARIGGPASIDLLFNLAQDDPASRVRAQAVRAMADLVDPMLVRHRLVAGRGDSAIARRIADLARDAKPRVQLEVLITLGRLHWSGAPRWLAQTWKGGDPAQSHAALRLLRDAENWPDVLARLDQPDQTTPTLPDLRTVALRALGDRANPTIVAGIEDRLKVETDSRRRRQYVDLLARVYKRPAPWTYWGFRPAPRPANTIAWERTDSIAAALNRTLADADTVVRRSTLRRMRREQVPVRLDALANWLRDEQDADHVAAILEALEGYPVDQTQPLLIETIASEVRDQDNRVAALRLFERGLTPDTEGRLVDLAKRVEEGPVLAVVLEMIGNRPQIAGNQFLLESLSSESADVRIAALRAIGNRQLDNAAPQVLMLLSDTELEVRRSAASVTGALKVHAAAPLLLKMAATDDLLLRSVCLDSLRQLQQPTAVSLAVESLATSETQLAALAYLADFGTARQLDVVDNVAATNRSVEVLSAVGRVFASWLGTRPIAAAEQQRIGDAIARLHGDTGHPIVWSVAGPLEDHQAQQIVEQMISSDPGKTVSTDSGSWQRVMGSGVDSVIRFAPAKEDGDRHVWLAAVDLSLTEAVQAQFLTSVDGVLDVWLNGRPVFKRQQSGPFQPNSDRFEGVLIAGKNSLLVKLVSSVQEPQFHLRFRAKTSQLEHERLAEQLLTSEGGAERGRELFLNAEKSLCIKCHRLGAVGGQIGPDLTGVGSRFSRIHLIESLLTPSRTIAPSYATLVIALDSGKVVTGVKIAETTDTIIVGNQEGKQQTIAKSQIEELQVGKLSIMPEGFEKRLTASELTDLIAFLISEKKRPQK